MFKSIFEDVKANFRYGDIITRLILINVVVFVCINLIYAFSANIDNGVFYQSVITNLGLPSDLSIFLRKPWTLFTSIFVHKSFWHLIWNMVLLYWFGRIVEDLIGSKHILSVYLLGGLFSGIIYLLAALFIPSIASGYVIGASGAVMAFVMLAASIAPDYSMRLILIGPVKIKYIALVILFMDIVGVFGGMNSGGHIVHLGGALFGYLYGMSLHNGVNIADRIQVLYSPDKKKKRTNLSVEYRTNSRTSNIRKEKRSKSNEEELNNILEKIKREGYEQLTKEEKEFLFLASKK